MATTRPIQPTPSCTPSLAVIGPVLGVTVAAVLFHLLLSRSHAAAVHDAAWRRVCAVGADMIGDDMGGSPASHAQRLGGSEAFRRWSFAALRDSGVTCTMLFDRDGKLRESYPSGFGFDDQSLAQLLVTDHSQRVAPSVQGEPMPAWSIAAPIVRQPFGDVVGTVVMLSALSNDGRLGGWRGSGLQVVWLLLPLSVLFACLGVGAQRRRMRRLLGGLVRGLGSTERTWRAGLPVDRSDIVGTLARLCAASHDEVISLRRESAELKRDMDHRVSERVRQVDALLVRAEKKNWIDALTGLGNRRLLDEQLEQVFCRQRDNREEFTVIMFDADHFKGFNDSQGHRAGDELLQFIGELLKTILRSGDVAIRYGGDEFAVLLLGANSSDAAHLAERVVKMFAQRTDLLRGQPRVTLSAGIASMQLHSASSGAALLELADQALYEAKGNGRNGVVIKSSCHQVREERPLSLVK